MDMEKRKFDISQTTREELQFILSSAKGEWKEYTNCVYEVNSCKKRIKKLHKVANDFDSQKLGSLILLVISIIFITGILFSIFLFGNNISDGLLPILYIVLLFSFLCLFSCPFVYFSAKSKIKIAQDNIKKNEEEEPLSKLQEKEENAKNKFNQLLNIPFKYWDEYALTTLLQYIEDYEASDWERATDLYKEAEYRRLMIENAQMTLAAAQRQTEIALQTRNATRMAAFGSMVSAAGILRINSKL